MFLIYLKLSVIVYFNMEEKGITFQKKKKKNKKAKTGLFSKRLL